MTREQFEALQDRPCDLCLGHVEIRHNPNNNAQQVVCSNCAARIPWRNYGVVNLKQTTVRRRKAPPMGKGLYEVWEQFGNRCAFCTLPQSYFVWMRIGIESHHVTEYAKTEHDGPVIPLCKPCHAIATARQRELWHVYRRVQELLHAEPIPPSRTELLDIGVSSHSVSSEREAPVGSVEGFSDDDAQR